ncbi:hypothetical protein ITP53_17255 [Nonomuraea sp. K274]|uniref:Uncharacterized protein n=1 Tax=Nonomuraea cypriaca TaxID=1187855 RepID=A0A931ACD5_9ACTN|nr:hypothetical protein [Nonomuraea cypriaca]MBF8187450.1 hypothetical protein [Nonomuraea cypriaca]
MTPATPRDQRAASAPARGNFALPSSGRRPAWYGRRVPRTGPAAALVPLAPALPHPPGTVWHVPDLVGAVLLAGAVAAGVPASSWGCAWGRLSSPGRTAAFAVPPAGWLATSRRPRPDAIGTRVPVAAPPAAVLLAATALVRVAVASGLETVHRSRRAAEEGPAASRRLLAGPP